MIRILQYMEMEIKQDPSAIIDDTIEGIYKLLNSNYKIPVNIGNPNECTINELILMS